MHVCALLTLLLLGSPDGNSCREKIVRPLSAGLHVVSNGCLDADPQWFKSVHGRKIFRDCLRENGVLNDADSAAAAAAGSGGGGGNGTSSSSSTWSSSPVSSKNDDDVDDDKAALGVLTGHEHEDTLFCGRTKLHRFFAVNEYGTVTRSNLWQNMGVGEVCIFRSKDDPERARVVSCCLTIDRFADDLLMLYDQKTGQRQVKFAKVLGLAWCNDHCNRCFVMHLAKCVRISL